MAKEFKTIQDVSDTFDALENKLDELKLQFDEKDPELKKALEDIKQEQEVIKTQMVRESEKVFAKQKIKETEGWNDKKALEFGKMVYCTMSNLKPESAGDFKAEKAKEFYEEINSLYEKADLGTPLYTDATTGSYTIAVDYLADVARVKIAESQLIGQINRIPTFTKTTYFPTTETVPEFTYTTSDIADTTETNPTFGQGTLTDYNYVLWIGMSESILEDNIINLGGYFRDLIGDALITKMEQEFLTGSGSPTTGIFNNTSINNVTLGEQDFASADLDDIDNVVAELSLAKINGAQWIMSPSVWHHFTTQQNAVGTYFIPDIQQKPVQMFKGYNVILSDNAYAMSNSQAGRVMCVFGNPKHMIWGDRLGLEVGIYDKTLYAVTNMEVILRARFRMSFAVSIADAFAGLKTAS